MKKPAKGHQKRFEQRLDKNFHPTGNNWYWLKIAAVFVVVLGIGYFALNPLLQPEKEVKIAGPEPVEKAQPKTEPVYLSDVSPAYKKIEDYYLATIHTELAQLDITKENKALIDSFMAQLAELDEEYKRLNKELHDVGVNEQTVAVLIENLKLRLDLLFKLKNKLNELQKTSLKQTKGNKI
ncbi:MAG TPA: hypothetical protein VFM65_00165 [Flavobacteriaceae bacterium]|nr:hypothetical protein [Flavobacteriaceae bacterium]